MPGRRPRLPRVRLLLVPWLLALVVLLAGLAVWLPSSNAPHMPEDLLPENERDQPQTLVIVAADSYAAYLLATQLHADQQAAEPPHMGLAALVFDNPPTQHRLVSRAEERKMRSRPRSCPAIGQHLKIDNSSSDQMQTIIQHNFGHDPLC